MYNYVHWPIKYQGRMFGQTFFFNIDKILSHGKVFEMYPELALCQRRKNKALLLSILVRKIGCRARAALILMGTCLSLDERDKSFGIISPSSH